MTIGVMRSLSPACHEKHVEMLRDEGREQRDIKAREHHETPAREAERPYRETLDRGNSRSRQVEDGRYTAPIVEPERAAFADEQALCWPPSRR
jgi:hypothetical protein